MSDPIAAANPDDIVEEADYEVIYPDNHGRHSRIVLSKKLKRTLKYFIASLSLLLPITFGGVHEAVFYPVYFCSFILGAYLLTILPKNTASKLGASSLTLISGMALLLIWTLLQQTFFRFQSAEHSILETTIKHGSSGAYLGPALSLLFCFSCAVISLIFLHSKKSSTKWLSSVIIFSGFMVSLIALSHWFYDNGRLFWFIEPDNIFTSNRARWPFVNSNHLGHFLLVPIFVSIASLRKILSSSNSHNHEGQENNSRMKKISRLGTSRGQTKLIKLLYVFLASLSMLLALFGSLSRGALFGFSIGVLLLSFSSIITREKNEELIKTPGAAKLSDDRRRRRRNGPDPSVLIEKYMSKLIKALPFLVALSGVFLFVFFLSGEGAERLEGRLEYSLLHSKDNIRWEMYKDSIEIVKDYPLGIGLGNWRHIYPAYASERLAGLNPVYLHSDILQLVVELGIPSALLILGLALIFFFGVGKRCLLRPRRFLEKSCFSGILALLVASFLDFPFRIPAILWVFCLGLSLLSYLDDKSIDDKPSGM